MATNLNPGADPQIAAAAYRAGMAGVPLDLRETFKEMGEAYAGGIEKMGEGLAKVAEVGALAGAKLVQDIKLGSVGLDKENVTKPIWSSFKDLAKKRLDIFKGIDPGTGEKFADDQAKMDAKQDWKEEKDGTLEIVSALRNGTMMNATSIANNMVNLDASDTDKQILMRALHHGGAAIPDGPGAGCYVKMERNEEGKFEAKLYGPGGKAVSGFSEDGAPQFTDKSDLSITMESVEKKAETPTGFEAKKFLDGYEWLEGTARRKLTGLLDGSISPEDMSEREIKSVQWALQDMGYNIDYTNKAGELITGEDAGDGEWGDVTSKAFNLLKADEQKARDEKAGDLWSDISAMGEEREQITVNPLNIKNLVTSKDLDSQLAVEKAGSEFGVTAGLNSDLPFDEGGLRQTLLMTMNNSADPRNTTKDLMHTGLLGVESFANHLSKPNQWTMGMMDAIKNIDGITDVSGDGEITAADFDPSEGNVTQNMKTLRDEMLNPDNPMSKNLLIDFYTGEIKKKFDVGRAERDAKANQGKGNQKNALGLKTDRSYFQTNFTDESGKTTSMYVTGEDIFNHSQMFTDIEAAGIGAWTAYNGATYRLDGDQWHKTIRDNKGELLDETKVSRNTVLNDLRWITMPSVMKSIGTSEEADKKAKAKREAARKLQEDDIIIDGINYGPAKQYEKNDAGNWVNTTISATDAVLWQSDGDWVGMKNGAELNKILEERYDPNDPN